jgi:hypothetical protein
METNLADPTTTFKAGSSTVKGARDTSRGSTKPVARHRRIKSWSRVGINQTRQHPANQRPFRVFEKRGWRLLARRGRQRCIHRTAPCAAARPREDDGHSRHRRSRTRLDLRGKLKMLTGQSTRVASDAIRTARGCYGPPHFRASKTALRTKSLRGERLTTQLEMQMSMLSGAMPASESERSIPPARS